MRIIETIAQWQALSTAGRLGFVPTMGNLHPGHMALVERSLQENTQTVMSIFINPKQFNDKNDFDKYPRTRAADKAMAEKAGVDYLLIPDVAEMYLESDTFVIHENRLATVLEGVSRPGHFSGMLTIVMKLLQLINPRAIYLGEKDYQQLQLVQEMVKAFFLEVQVIGVPTIRLHNQLPYSSRNNRLTSAEQEAASLFSKLLLSELPLSEVVQQLEKNHFVVEYIEDHQARRYGAVQYAGVRLVDNVPRQQLKFLSDNCGVVWRGKEGG